MFTRQNEKDRWRVKIPQNVSENLVRELHEASEHPGRHKIHELVTESCTFKDIKRIIVKLVLECDAGQRNKPRMH